MIAFHAAVHAVNAYLWEARRYAPGSHGDRWREIQYDPRINGCQQAYSNLNFAGFHARHNETFSIAQQDARALLEVHFRRVEATVMQALGQPAPVW